MKADWQTMKLREVCYDIFAGGDVPKDNHSKFVTEKHQIPIYTNGEKNDGLYGYTEVARVTLPSVTISARGTIGYASIRSESYYPAIRLIVLIPNQEILDVNFLFYGIANTEIVHSGTSIPQLTVPMVRDFEIPLPPLPKQQRIVAILDEAFDGIATARANAEQNLKNARELFESHLQSVFTQKGEGWVEYRLGDVCDFSQGIQVDVKLQSEDMQGFNKVRFLRIVDFTQGNESPRYIDNPGEKYVVNESDVSLVRYGACGFVCSGLNGAIANNLFRVIPKNKQITNGFLYWFLKSPLFQDVIKKSMNGVAMPAISFGMINDIFIPFPSESEQRSLISKLGVVFDETQRLEVIYQKKITALDELKKALLHKAFSGEL